MPERQRLLILGGTRDAAVLAQEAVTRWGNSTDVISSLAGRTSTPVEIAGTVRTGGFGGADAMAGYLEAEHVTAVIDATHPFAARISANAAAACDQTGTPRVLLDRPMWERQHGDRWHMVADAAQAAGMLDRFGHRAFLTTGRSGLDCFAACTGAWFLVRLVELPIGPLHLADYHVIADRGPFTVDGEKALLERHKIDVIVCKASGGEMTRAKLDAARLLGLPVVMIARPPLPGGPQAGSVSAVLTWLDELLA